MKDKINWLVFFYGFATVGFFIVWVIKDDFDLIIMMTLMYIIFNQERMYSIK